MSRSRCYRDSHQKGWDSVLILSVGSTSRTRVLACPCGGPRMLGPTMADELWMYGRKMCNKDCGRWAVFDTDGQEPLYWCPLCWNANEAVDVDTWWSWRMNSLAPRSSLQATLDVPDVSAIVRSFVVHRPDKYTNCCRCDDWNTSPCIISWFDDGWVCPDFWHNRKRRG